VAMESYYLLDITEYQYISVTIRRRRTRSDSFEMQRSCVFYAVSSVIGYLRE